jgi:hypothetical protein
MYRRVFAAGLLAAVATLSGCGPKPVPAGGVVTLDGAPVDGAMVTFVADQGGATYTGLTDSAGAFTLSSGGEPGAMPGRYKVLVTRTAPMAGGEGTDPGTADYFKMMQKMKDEAKASAKAAMPKMPTPGMMPGGMAAPPPVMMPPGGGPGGPGGPAPPPRTDLPAKYASIEKSDLTATIEGGGSKDIQLRLVTPPPEKKR